jgi:hypothetical protein
MRAKTQQKMVRGSYQLILSNGGNADYKKAKEER